MRKPLLFIICYLTITFQGISQENFSYALMPFAGKFISHKDLRTASESYQYGVVAEISKETFGKKYWQYAHNYPKMGLHIEARNLGNSKQYGNAYSLIPYLEFSLKKWKRASLSLRHGTGLSFVSKKYNELTNPTNQLIGSAINATSFIGMNYQFSITNKVDLKLGGFVKHISNGSLQLPNAGTNSLSAYAGIAYYPLRIYHQYQTFLPYRDFSKWRYKIETAMGLYHYAKQSHTIEHNWQAGFLIFRQHNSRFRTGVGTEFGYLASKNYKIQPTIYLEEEVQFKNISTIYQFGTYLANTRQPGEKYYSKIGIAYYPLSKSIIPCGWYIGSALKAHNYKAAHVELSTGFVF